LEIIIKSPQTKPQIPLKLFQSARRKKSLEDELSHRIMLANRGDRPILIDFGVVNQQNLTQVSDINYHSSQPGTTVGKIGYSPIEQIQQGKCYPNSDLYSLAVTALVLLSGKEPEQFFDSYRMQWQWRNEISLSDDLGQIIDKMLEISPQQRYQSAQEILADLAASPITFYIPSVPDTSNSSVPATFVCPNSSDREICKIAVATVLSESSRSQLDRAVSSTVNATSAKKLNIIGSSLVLVSLGVAVMGIKYFSETQKQNDSFDRQTNTKNTDLFDNPNAPQSPNQRSTTQPPQL
jgi:serine/threonine protein kinase